MRRSLGSRKLLAVIALALAAAPSPAMAHEVMGVTGFPASILHSLVLIDHVLCLLAAGLFAGRREYPVLAWMLVAMLAGMLAGFAALLYLPTFSRASLAPLAAAAVLSGLVAADLRLPVAATAGLLAAAGFSIGLNTIPEAGLLMAFVYAIGGAIIAACVLVGLLALGVSRLGRPWQRIGVRIAGSWIAASAILVLTLVLIP